MNTPTHLLIGAAVFARRGQPKVTAAALMGALVPDISLYLMSAWAMYVQGVSPGVVFRDYYFSLEWQRVFSVDNSFVLWGMLFGVACRIKRGWLIAFAGAALLHLAGDFSLHNDDARAHFWPLSDWVFQSPLSYWDRAHYASIIAPLEILLCFGLCAVLWHRFEGRWPKVVIGITVLLLAMPSVLWMLAMTGSISHAH